MSFLWKFDEGVFRGQAPFYGYDEERRATYEVIQYSFFARAASIALSVVSFIYFLLSFYLSPEYFSLIENFVFFVIQTMCMCFLASAVVKGKQGLIFVAFFCQAVLLLRSLFWSFIMLIRFRFPLTYDWDWSYKFFPYDFHYKIHKCIFLCWMGVFFGGNIGFLIILWRLVKNANLMRGGIASLVSEEEEINN